MFNILEWLGYDFHMPLGKYLTVKEVADRLGVGVQRTYDLIEADRLKITRVGGRIFIHERDLRKLKIQKRGRPKKNRKHLTD